LDDNVLQEDIDLIVSDYDTTRSMQNKPDGSVRNAALDGGKHVSRRSVAEAWKAFQDNPTDDHFRDFHAMTSGLVYTICSRILYPDASEVEDAFQSVYSHLVEGVRTAALQIPKEHIETELRRLARRCADTRRKRISRRGRREISLEGIDIPETERRTVREHLYHQEVGELISDILDTLPDSMRLAITLHYYHGMTHQEIADVVGGARSNVTKIIQKGTKILKKRLREAGILDSRLAVLFVPPAMEWLQPPASFSAESLWLKMATSSTSAMPSALGSGGGMSSMLGGGLSVKKLALAAIVLLGLMGLFFAGRARITNPGTLPPAATGPEQADPETAASALPTGLPSDESFPNSQDSSSASAADSAVGEGELLGRVVSLYTREPLPGVTLQLRKGTRQAGYAEDSRRDVVTDSRGEFRFAPGESGYYQIQALPSTPWQPLLREIYLRHDKENRTADLELYRLGVVRGRVVQLPDDEGISGLRIQLVNAMNRDWPETTTDAQGRFEFTGLTWIYYDLWILERHSFAVRVDMTQGDTREIDIPFGDGVLQGRVYREDQPYGFAEVRVFPEGSVHDASQVCSTRIDGTYRLGGLAPGRYRVEAVSQDIPLKRQVAVAWVDVDGEGTAENDMILPSGVLNGWVFNEQDEPASGALVLVRDCAGPSPAAVALSPVREIQTCADGSFTIVGLPPGEYWATAMAPTARRSRPIQARVPSSGSSAPARLTLESGANGQLISAVYDAQTGRPIHSAWCILSSASGPCEHRASREEDGTLHIAALPAGEYEVEIGAYGYSSRVHRVRITTDKPVVLHDSLREAGAFRWTFKTPEGLPEPGIECRLHPRDNLMSDTPRHRQGTTGSDGSWVVRGLYPGDYIATASLPAGELSEVVTIRPRDITSRRFFRDEKKGEKHAE
jgi:RNA polymerase sigma factor (sigma-70 family)